MVVAQRTKGDEIPANKFLPRHVAYAEICIHLDLVNLSRPNRSTLAHLDLQGELAVLHEHIPAHECNTSQQLILEPSIHFGYHHLTQEILLFLRDH